MNGRVLGRWVADHLAQAATRPPAGAHGLRSSPQSRLAWASDRKLIVSDLVIPYVIHWDGEPEPDLSGIDDPIRVPFRFVPAYTGGSERLATPRAESDHSGSYPAAVK